jgi:hypothetical protein
VRGRSPGHEAAECREAVAWRHGRGVAVAWMANLGLGENRKEPEGEKGKGERKERCQFPNPPRFVS